jgi:pimeloyl-ACP methyl ester carboxylesterase
MSGAAWRETVPLLTAHHTVYTPSALGHRGGPAVQRRPATIWEVIDASERFLDENKLDRPHLAGHSLGGFVAIELARRGRAASVCAFSPGGFWSDDLRIRNIQKVRRRVALGRFTRRLTPLMMRSPMVRQRALRLATLHGDRLTVDRAVEIVEEPFDCTILDDIFNNADEYVKSMDQLPCPITVAWAEKDTALPLKLYEAAVRESLPRATFTVLPDVAHVPMLDDPGLVARTILAVTGAAKP